MKNSELLFTALRPPLDYSALIFAAIAGYYIRYLPMIQNIRPVAFNLAFQEYFAIIVVISAIWIILFALTGLYSFGGIKKTIDEFSKIFIACSAGLAVVLAIMVFSRYLFDSRFIIIASWVFAIIFVSTERLILKLLQKIAHKAGFGIHRIIIIGESRISQELISEFNNKPGLGYKIIGSYKNFDLESTKKIKELALEDKLDEIIQINPNVNFEETMELIDLANEHHLDFRYTADLLDTQLTNLEVEIIAGTPIIKVKRTRLDGWGKINKRIFDFFGSIILLFFLAPVLLIIALIIKIDSKGPILFKYKRIGQFGRQFTYFKFRSMIKDAHKYRFDQNFLNKQQNLRQGSPMIKFKDDPRITRVGKLIRRLSLDELPELFLVLLGKMSLVGPRPHEIEEVQRYQKHHKKVMAIKPGITGMSQVSGRSDLDFEEEIKLDTFYIENWSLALDLIILLKTPLAVLKRRQTE